MKHLFAALVYMALGLGANADMSEIAALRDGDMRKLNFHTDPRPVSDAEFRLADDAGPATLERYRGQWVLLNFWATWCAPCRKEMPMLAALQTEFGGPDFAVVTLATGRNSPTGIAEFLREIGAENLPRHQDPRQAVARDMAVLGLPVTVLINPDGQEVARLVGDADWNSESARAIISALLQKTES